MTDSSPKRIFIIYAHKDDDYRVELRKSLRPLEREDLVEVWDDREILPGDNWDDQIDERLDQVDLFLPLVSRDFVASEYINGVELKRALERHEKNQARVVPVIIRSCGWKNSALARLDALPDKGRAINSWDDTDQAWTFVEEGIRRVLGELPERGDAADAGTDQPDPCPYFETLVARNRYIEIQGIGAKVAERMELRHVYTRLRVAARSEQPERRKKGGEASEELLAQEASSERELRDVLGQHDHAVLVGDPGSGKTTFLRFVALNLARLRLNPADAKARESLALDGEAPFPLLVRLGDFATYLREADDCEAHPRLAEDASEHFYLYLERRLRDDVFGLPRQYLRERVLGGGCFLLLDGLDEVPGRELRERIARIVEGVVIAGERAGNRHLVTCRARAYAGGTQLLAGDFETFQLASFDREQIEEFVRGWSRALHRVTEGDTESAAAGEAERDRKALLEAIGGHPNVGPLTESPLMLTVLAVVHWNRKRLPEQRADLYQDAVDCLLERRRKHSRQPPTLRREALQALALRMVDDPAGVQRTLGRAEAAEAVKEVLGLDRGGAIAFLEDEELYSGLLVSRMEGEVEFWHLTFQEYLAALELARDPECWTRIEKHLHDDRWNEVVLLLAGCLRRDAGVRAAARFLQRILDTGADLVDRARAVGLAGRILGDIRPYGGEPERQTTYGDALRETISIFEPDGPEAEELVRVEVGDALGQAGDPRLDEDHKEANRVLIRGGEFWMGAQKTDRGTTGYDEKAWSDESPVHRVTISDFRLGRYPVTVQEFREFVEAGESGYLDQKYWDPEGWEWRERKNRREPGNWQPQLRHPNRPVTQVTWYEADAYCRWDGGRLPTEAQWEYAARGGEGRRYPWGSAAPSEQHASFSNRVDHPTPVGIYPQGPTADGLHDMAGNVWEWCADFHAAYTPEDCEDPEGPESGTARVLRGGAFYDGPQELRASFRSCGGPEIDLDDFGFRVAWSPPAGR